MKKTAILLLLTIAFGFVCFAAVGCQKSDDEVIDIYLPDGAPALALVSLFDREEIGGHKVKFTVVTSDAIGAELLKEVPDLAIAPTNVIAKVYNKGKDYKFASAHTHGNLYVVGNETLSGLDALKGKTVGVIGMGMVPDIIFKTILSKAGIEYSTSEEEGKVTIKYYSGGAEAMLAIGKQVDFGLLAEPAVSTAYSKGFKEVFDIQRLWGEEGYPQAGLAVKNGIDDDFILAFFDELEKAGDFAAEHPDEAVARIAEHMAGSTASSIQKLTSDTVARCNIKLKRAAECKDDVTALLQAFADIDPESIGGVVPNEGFFRIVK